MRPNGIRNVGAHLAHFGGTRLGVGICCAALGTYLAVSGLWLAWGMHDNDWPLLMWLMRAWSWDDLTPLFIGHYPPMQLLLVQGLAALRIDTLVAAKLLNIVATVGCAALVYATARQLVPRTSVDRAWGLVAMAVFALSAETLLTGQSEFADPLATCALVGALYCFFSHRSALVVGALLALSGWFRLHFVAFGLGVACVLALQAKRPSIIAGWLLAAAPPALASYLVTGSAFSPVAGTFIGQVLFGYDEHHFVATYARHPFSEVLTEHWAALVQLLHDRLLDCPKRFLPLLLVVTLGLRDRRAQLLWLCAVGYYLGVIAPSWAGTTRLLMPFVALLALGCAAALGHGRFQHRGVLTLLAFVLVRVLIAWHAVPDELRRVTSAWDASAQLTLALRELGMKEPREAFVVDWYRAPTDTAEHAAFYNFGFWNLLNARFALERPLGDSVSHFKRNGVRWVVLSTKDFWRPSGQLRFAGARTTDMIFNVSLADAEGAAAAPRR